MSAIILFEEKQVRRAWNQAEEKWYFSIDDVVQVLTGSVNVKDYIKKLRKRDAELSAYWGTNCPLVEMPGADGKIRPIRAASTEALLRIIQSIPSPKAEPFKLWLAQVGYERLEEIENPELAAKRMRQIYRQKGYSDEWIEKRVRGIAVRDELTDEWKKRGVKEQRDFAILTAEISKATFGMTPAEYKDFKALANPKDAGAGGQIARDTRPDRATRELNIAPGILSDAVHPNGIVVTSENDDGRLIRSTADDAQVLVMRADPKPTHPISISRRQRSESVLNSDRPILADFLETERWIPRIALPEPVIPYRRLANRRRELVKALSEAGFGRGNHRAALRVLRRSLVPCAHGAHPAGPILHPLPSPDPTPPHPVRSTGAAASETPQPEVSRWLFRFRRQCSLRKPCFNEATIASTAPPLIPVNFPTSFQRVVESTLA